MTSNEQLRRQLEETLRREESEAAGKISRRKWIVWGGVVIMFLGLNMQCSEVYRGYDPYEKKYFSDIPGLVQWFMIFIVGGAALWAVKHIESYSQKVWKDLSYKQDAAKRTLRGEDSGT